MTPKELEELMSDCAENAVKTAKDEFDVTLDFSKQSIANVDDLLLSFIDKYHDQALENEAVFTLCNIFGAYTGETMRRFVDNSQWIYDQSNPNAPYVLLGVGENTYAFAGICYERLVNNSETSVQEYFTKALANHQ
ncbi:MAG TPA: hypothetical protein DCW74_00350 [Alteromonas australica]|jgi:hypothetical protein|uniref:DUF3806 domain-containing protein n=1 Tax=Alteromonas australica TaxID=589873 RepID=A0A075NWA7_9ALTE|nr:MULTISPECIES: hypothetical protein [Alteromonas]MAB94459.1 hypothetical protein [Alteromonas sp.]AIF98894.1 hypothetical protein EP13_09515 [Alteromonas australica]AJP43892.1 hypothetical protein EP12_09680 [Alteromonas australica]MAF69572.1 hypothetical protein [Alteromonas sp.]MAO30700.1 hypothetical protein [Alteromonas sp.]|tara:strand:- start:422 stop:829 length:408 start_codon:yes stop_codon:yes gene_type:complete